MKQQIICMLERFLTIPESEREQAVIEARNILENFRIIGSAAIREKERNLNDDSADGNNDDSETVEGILRNALEEAVLFQELLLLHPELLAKLLEEHNKKLQAILSDLRQRTDEKPNYPEHNQTPPEEQQRLIAKELEKQVQNLRLQAACEIKEMRAKSKKPSAPINEKGLDSILEQLVKPAMAQHEKTIAISKIFQVPKEALAIAESANQQSEHMQEQGSSKAQDSHIDRR